MNNDCLQAVLPFSRRPVFVHLGWYAKTHGVPRSRPIYREINVHDLVKPDEKKPTNSVGQVDNDEDEEIKEIFRKKEMEDKKKQYVYNMVSSCLLLCI